MSELNKIKHLFESDLVLDFILPDDVDPEILEWFHFHKKQNHLSNELIKIVQAHLQSFEEFNEKVVVCDTPMPTSSAIEYDFLDSLYNWEESNTIPFNSEIKQKKKMLQV